MGAEKFLDIKCRYSGLNPQAAVLVATVRALKYHGGASLALLKEEVGYTEEQIEASVDKRLDYLQQGIGNLEKHIENIKQFNLIPIVAINKFVSDSWQEIDFIKEFCQLKGVKCCVAEVWLKGGDGAIELANEVVKVVEQSKREKREFIPMYDLDTKVEDKIFEIAQKVYGAIAVDYTPRAKKDLKKIYTLGLDKLAISMAKTQKSLSDNPELLGRPKDFIITVREIEIAAGAGFLVPITGDIMRMPGLPEHPAAIDIDIDENGEIVGLF